MLSTAETTTPRREHGEALGASGALVKARTDYSCLDFRTVAGAALSSVDSVLSRWLPNGKRTGHEYATRNPTRSDNRPGSFSINTSTGAWGDFATGDAGGDLVSLIAYLEGTNQLEAADRLADFLGLPGARPYRNEPGQPGQPGQPVTARVSAAPAGNARTGATGANEGEPLAPVPDDAPPPPETHPTRGRPSKVWTYPDAAGRVLMCICRFDKPDQGKDVIPLTLWRIAGAYRWQWKGLPAPRPLYGLDRLAGRPDAPVLICEGEKAADAAGELLPAFVAMTSPNGAKSASKSDWSAIAGRRVLIWPDADEQGAAYAADVERLALEAGASDATRMDLDAIAKLRGSPLPEAWDAADALAEGMDRAALERLAADALEQANPPPLDDEHEGQTPAEVFAAARAAKATKPKGEGLPRFDLVESVKGRRPGVYWCGVERDRETGEERPAPPVWICAPLHIKANTRDERGSEWGRLLEWRDRDERAHRWAMPCEMLAGSGEELRAALLREGLDITSEQSNRRRLLDYIAWSRPGATARAVTRTGWHGTAFVFPHHTVGDTEAEPIHYQAATAEGVRLGSAGTLEGWRERVAAPCAGNSRLVLALSASLAASCLDLLGAEGGGLHLRGGSSAGKTTALLVAASTWGPSAFVRTWRNTDNALESVAALHSDLLLCLDEMGELPAKVAGATAYMLANGSGKGRARRDGSARAAARWRVLFLSTGEIGLADLIVEGGGRVRAGQEVRVIDMPADAGAGLGLFERLPTGMTPGAFADSLRDAAAADYGHAGPAFVARLVRDYPEARVALRTARDAIAATLAPADAAGQVRRVAQRFALIAAAGELATEWGITGWPAGEAEAAALACFRAWIGARGTAGSAEPAAMLAQVRRFLESHGESRFAPWEGDPKDRPTINRAGFRKPTADGAGVEFFVLAEAFRAEICAGFDDRAVARVLIEAGALLPDSDGGATRKERLPGMDNVRCFRILPTIWGADHA
jgi:uncharacterized protein (DUF927 family)